MVDDLVNALIRAAISRELERRKIFGRMTHLVCGEDRQWLDAAIQYDMVRRLGFGFMGGNRPFRS